MIRSSDPSLDGQPDANGASSRRLPIVADYRDAVHVLRNPASFPQWDGAYLTPAGLQVASLRDPIPADWTVIPSISGRVPEIDGSAHGFAQTPLFLDPPLHGRFRSLLDEGWSVGTALPRLAPMAQGAARRLVKGEPEGGKLEFMRSVAVPFSAIVLAEFFGGAREQWQAIAAEHAEVMWRPVNGPPELQHIDGFQLHIWHSMEEHAQTESPPNDAMSRMLRRSAQSADGLRLVEIQTLIVQSAFANTNVIRLLGLVMLVLAARPELRSLVREEPGLAEDVVSEILRISPPLRGVPRRTTQECRVGKLRLAAGAGLHVSFAGANRDPVRFPEPATLNPHRPRTRSHLAFGAGIHRCPAARLAVMMAVSVARAAAELRHLQLVPGGVVNCPDELSTTISELWLDVGER